MKKNMGSTDRVIRLLLATVFAMLGYFKVIEAPISTVFYVLAAVFVLTSLMNFCPLYTIFGLNTCKIKE